MCAVNGESDMIDWKNLSVAAPWSLSHYIALNGFHPIYRALFDHAPENMQIFAWDNVKLYRRFSSDINIREAMLSDAKVEKERLSNTSVAEVYHEYFWPPNRVLTSKLLGEIEFHHTAPFPSLKRPFVLHCEMFAPVWFPFSQQGSGRLDRVNEIREHYRSIFANPLCLGIFSHVPETLRALSQFFCDQNIDNKLFASRIGLSANAICDPSLATQPSLQSPRFLFVNSANQNPANFFRRGGHLVLRFWREYLAEGRTGLLMLRCAKPNDEDLDEYGVDVSLVRAETGRSIIWGQDYLANHEMNALMASAHFFLLPSASLHSVSIMQAMTLGAIPAVTDTVGTSVYVSDQDTGIVLQGMYDAIWRKDISTGILVDHYKKTPSLDEELVSQLTRRVCSLLDRPETYRNMRHRMMSMAQEQFSGQAFSDQFWCAVSSLYQRYRDSGGVNTTVPCQEKHSLLDCMVQSKEWSRVFESPTQPLQRVNTGYSIVWEMGGAFIQAYGNPSFRLSDWSVLAKYYSAAAPLITFAYTLEELGGRYLSFTGHPGEAVINESIDAISRILKPYPIFHRQAARVWREIRRIHAYVLSRFLKPKANNRDGANNFNVELVRHGIAGYNIVRHFDRYYAILQNEGAFSPTKAEAGGYSSCLSGYSLEEVERAIGAAQDFNARQDDSHQRSATGTLSRD